MQNKITFFRFSKSEVSLDPKLKDMEKRFKINYKNHRRRLEKLPKIEYKKLNDNESRILVDYSETNAQFKQDLNFEEKELLGEIIDDNGCILKPTEKHHSIIKKYYEHLCEKFNILELNRLIIQKAFNRAFESINETKDHINKNIPQDRIEIQDINELNSIIENENRKGWIVKQIEGIQSGHYDNDYGYSFTEGVMIVWKKE